MNYWRMSIGGLIVLSLLLIHQAMTINDTTAQDANSGSPVTDPNETSSPPVKQPTIIWFHSISSHSPESLRTALSSGLISHVMLLYMHRNDANWQDEKAQEAIALVKASSARLIWCRDLWPYYKNKTLSADAIYDPNYYVHEIFHLRNEALAMEADAVALDCEPYGESVFKPVFKERVARSRVDLVVLRQAVTQAVTQVGKVNYILPGGSTSERHPYNVVCLLGENRICESTYYNRPERLARVTYPYDIFGAYLRPFATNRERPLLPYFTPMDLFTHSELWSHKKGLFLYSDGRNSLATAKSLVQYVEQLRTQASPSR
jgi:hypothetical protein